jgi:hypothetical protein
MKKFAVLVLSFVLLTQANVTPVFAGIRIPGVVLKGSRSVRGSVYEHALRFAKASRLPDYTNYDISKLKLYTIEPSDPADFDVPPREALLNPSESGFVFGDYNFDNFSFTCNLPLTTYNLQLSVAPCKQEKDWQAGSVRANGKFTCPSAPRLPLTRTPTCNSSLNLQALRLVVRPSFEF